VLVAPLAGVGRIHTDHRDATASRHGGQPITELSGGDTDHGAAQSFAPLQPRTFSHANILTATTDTTAPATGLWVRVRFVGDRY
jgi:hypothetical protein